MGMQVQDFTRGYKNMSAGLHITYDFESWILSIREGKAYRVIDTFTNRDDAVEAYQEELKRLASIPLMVIG